MVYTLSDSHKNLCMQSSINKASLMVQSRVDFAAVLTPIVADRVGAEPTVDLAAVADIFAQHSADLLNEQQQRLLEHLERRLGGDA